MKEHTLVPFADEREFTEAVCRWGKLLIKAVNPEEIGQAACAYNDLRERCTDSAEAGVFLPLPYLSLVFAENPAAEICLYLAFLPEVDREFFQEFLHLDPAGEGCLTAGLAVMLAEKAGFSSEQVRRVLAPGEMLDVYCFEGGGSGLFRQLKPVQRLADFVLAGKWEDPGEPGLYLWQPDGTIQSPEKLISLANRMLRYLEDTEAENETVTFQISGLRGAGRKTLAKAAESCLKQPLLIADGRFLLEESGGEFRRCMMREAYLQQCPVCLTNLDDDAEAAAGNENAAEFLTSLLKEISEPAGHSYLICETEWGGGPSGERWRMIPIRLAVPGLEESRKIWSSCLENYPLEEQINPDQLAGRYRLTPGQILQAVDAAYDFSRWQGLSGITGECIAQGCRSQLRHTLGTKARRVETTFCWEDLVLPETSKRLLRSACDQMKHKRQVFDSWGFGKKLAYGAGLSMLFSGPPGTGKTMAAQIAAGELGLELYKVDLSAVVSKYVGETEKNLNDIFREAVRSQAVLFFDEADVLFGKRTEVKDAHDKYNNMEAAFLLQKIEEYAGVSILATNFLQNFDEAFKRRIKFIIDFPFPDVRYRRMLWQKVFPAETPLEQDVDWDFLAGQFELSGSSIKNVAVNAAFLAAAERQDVGMSHLLTAVRRELMKNGKLLSREDFGEYYMLAEEDAYADI